MVKLSDWDSHNRRRKLVIYDASRAIRLFGDQDAWGNVIRGIGVMLQHSLRYFRIANCVDHIRRVLCAIGILKKDVVMDFREIPSAQIRRYKIIIYKNYCSQKIIPSIFGNNRIEIVLTFHGAKDTEDITRLVLVDLGIKTCLDLFKRKSGFVDNVLGCEWNDFFGRHVEECG